MLAAVPFVAKPEMIIAAMTAPKARCFGLEECTSRWCTPLLKSTNNIVLPGLLLVSACIMAIYRHITQGRIGYFGLRDMSLLVALQMFLLVALKVKLWTCKDKLALLRRFSDKVLFLHLVFISLRFFAQVLLIVFGAAWHKVWSLESWDFINDGTSLLAVYKILRGSCGLEFSRKYFVECWDLLLLAGAATAASFLTELADGGDDWQLKAKHATRENIFISTLFTGSNYVKVLTFVPAVWLLYRSGGSIDVFKPLQAAAETSSASMEAMHTQAVFFFTFLVSFYFTEDLVSPYLTASSPLVLAAHSVHFCLLLDFSGFFLHELHAVEGGKGEPLQDSA